MYYIGVHFGGISITAGIVSENGEIVQRGAVPTLKYRDFDVIVKDMAALCQSLVEDMGLNMERDIKYIGIGCGGTADNKNGTIAYSSYFDYHNAPIRDEMHKYVSVPVYIENDANCVALAENLWGAAKGHKNTVSVTVGYTIGAGIILDGRVYHGAFGGAGEAGHQVIVFQGEKCNCGRNGCWEAYASAAAIARDARIQAVRHTDSEMFKMVNGDIRVMSYKVPFEACRRGDPWACEIVELYTRYLAVGLINIINILQPEAIVLGGSMVEEIEYILDPLKEILDDKIYGNQSHKKEDDKTKILIAELGSDAEIIGAAMVNK